MKFQTIQKEVEAIQFTGNNYDKVKKFVELNSISKASTVSKIQPGREWFYLVCKSSTCLTVNKGDWIVIENKKSHAIVKSSSSFESNYMPIKTKVDIDN